MQSRDLISLLKNTRPDKELSIVVHSIENDSQIAVTYDIGYEVNENDELTLRISV